MFCASPPSISGAAPGVAVAADLKPGLQAILHWGRFEAFGEIRWHGEQGCGLEFFDPLNRAQIIITRDLDDRHRLPDEYRPPSQRAAAPVAGKMRI